MSEPNIKSGLVFRAPCLVIGGILNDFMRVTQDHYPYHFYGSTKTVAYATSLANEKPVASVKLIGSDGKKNYLVFRFHLLILESQYPNVYFGLILKGYDTPISQSLGKARYSGMSLKFEQMQYPQRKLKNSTQKFRNSSLLCSKR